MAVVFSTSLPTTDVLYSHSNNEVVFSSDAVGNEVRATIEINGITYEIQPINGEFFFNFKKPFISLFAGLNFVDDIEPDITGAGVATTRYDGSEITSFNTNVTYTIFLDAGGPDVLLQTYRVLQATEELTFFTSNLSENNVIPLLPIDTTETSEADGTFYSAVYFSGFPFDISFYSTITGNNSIDHIEDASSFIYNMAFRVTRMFFGDGDETDTLGDYIPVLENSFNTYRLNFVPPLYFRVEKTDIGCNGYYLKWKNSAGGWTYWFFENVREESVVSRSTGEIDRNFERYENTLFFNDLGKIANTRFKAKTDFMRGRYRRLVTSIFESPRIYMYFGERGTIGTLNEWIPVRLLTSGAVVEHRKNQFDALEIEFEMYKKDTLTL